MWIQAAELQNERKTLPNQLSQQRKRLSINKGFKFHIQRYSMASKETEYMRKGGMTAFLFLLWSADPHLLSLEISSQYTYQHLSFLSFCVPRKKVMQKQHFHF